MKKMINDKNVTSDHTLTYVDNPKKSGFKSYDRYQEYQRATTIDEYFEILDECEIDKKYGMPDLRYDMEKGFLTVTDSDGNEI